MYLFAIFSLLSGFWVIISIKGSFTIIFLFVILLSCLIIWFAVVGLFISFSSWGWVFIFNGRFFEFGYEFCWWCCSSSWCNSCCFCWTCYSSSFSVFRSYSIWFF